MPQILMDFHVSYQKTYVHLIGFHLAPVLSKSDDVCEQGEPPNVQNLKNFAIFFGFSLITLDSFDGFLILAPF